MRPNTPDHAEPESGSRDASSVSDTTTPQSNVASDPFMTARHGSDAHKISAAAFSSCDLPTAKDSLGFKPYVQAVTDFLINKGTRTPLTLSVEGEWGSGKSSFMRQMQDRLDTKKHRVVTFTPWRHDKDEALWAAFVLTFVDQLAVKMSFHEKCAARYKLFIRRFDWWQGWPTLALCVIKGALWLAFFGGLAWLWLTGLIEISKDFDDKSMEPYVNPLQWFLGTGGVLATFVGLYRLGRHVTEAVGNPLKYDLRKHLKSENYDERMSFIERFHQDFKHIVDVYARDRRVFVFIDDLDRCEIPRAADLMQAINLLISGNNNIVFILGLDREKVAASIAVKFEDVFPYIQRLGAAGAGDDDNRRRHAGIEFGYEYIEKFTQLPFQVPRPEPDKLDDFLDELAHGRPGLVEPVAKRRSFIEDVQTLWRQILKYLFAIQDPTTNGKKPPDAASEVADESWNRFRLDVGDESPAVREIVKMAAPALGYNPRRLVQFINIFRLRAYTAYRTRLFNPVDPQARPLYLEQLGKFVALTLRWPILLSKMAADPQFLHRISVYAEAVATGDPEGLKNKPTSWGDCTPLLRLLAHNADKPGDSEMHRRNSMQDLDVELLLRVSPGVTPPPRPAETAPSPRPEVKAVQTRFVEARQQAPVAPVAAKGRAESEYRSSSSDMSEKASDLSLDIEKNLKQLELCRSTGDRGGEAAALNNLVMLYERVSDASQAALYREQLLNLSKTEEQRIA